MKRTSLKAYILARHAAAMTFRTFFIGVFAWALVALVAFGAFAQGGMGPGPGTVHSAGSSFSVTTQGTAFNSGSGSSTTLPSWTYGSGCNNVLVGIGWGPSAATTTISSFTLDGSQAMTAVGSSFVDNSAFGVMTQFYYIANPTGSSGTPTIAFNSALLNGVGMQAWCIVTSTTTPSGGNGNSTGFAPSISSPLTVPSGGAIFGICYSGGSVGTWTFTNITFDSNITVRNQFGNASVGSGHATGGAGSSVSVICADSLGNNAAWTLSIATMAP